MGFARRVDGGAVLRAGPEPLSVVWSNPSRGTHASGLGVAGEGDGEVSWLGAPPPSLPGPWFGGWSFDARRPWAGFPRERWVLPEVLTWWDGAQTWQAAFAPEGATQQALEARLDAVEEVEPVTTPFRAEVVNEDRPGWTSLVEGALQAIERGAFSKVVTARALTVRSDRAWPERAVLKALEARHPQCFSFLVRGADGQAFVGASPELLCEARDGVFFTDALAGTSSRGDGERLLSSGKDRREHASVVDGIRASLGPFSASLEVPQTPSVKTLANVDHLHTIIRARLKPGVDPLVVAHALHPTPATAGAPRQSALDWLAEHEGFSRGWYTGVVGARGQGQLTLAVGLRSALLEGQLAQVFVGAGIVEGSVPEAEWTETVRKARAVLPALGVHDA